MRAAARRSAATPRPTQMSALPSTGRADRATQGADETRALYERHASRIFAFCFSRLGSREEAEDAAQTTFLNACRSLQSGVVPAFELAWLFRIADNVCRDRRKSAWRRHRIEAVRDLDELQDVIAAPETGSDGLAGLADALAAMPERQRRAILLREWQGLSYAEIARELGVSKAAVETLIFRARRSLARGLEEPPARRRSAGFDVGSLLALGKTLFSGGGAVKVAAVVAGAGLVAAVPLRDVERARPDLRPSPPVVESAPAGKDRAAPPAVVQKERVAPRSTLVAPKRAPASTRVPRAASPAGEPRTIPERPAGSASANPEPAPPVKGAAPDPVAPSAPSAPSAPEPSAPGATPPPPAPSLPEASLPEVPAVEPPALPDVPEPDLPVDVPDVPALPPLP